jgi:drug/metabolite transporter (DMT)-like permease
LDAVLFALASAVSFGGMTVALRVALRSFPEPDLGAVASTAAAVVVAFVAALLHQGTGELARPEELAVFAVAGLLAPGISQIFFTLAVRDVGAGRTSVVAGSAPLFAATLAILLLDEPFEWPLAFGACLIVGAGVVLAAETARPAHFRLIGAVFALTATIMFSSRDLVVRWYSAESALGSIEAAAAAMAAGMLVMLGYAAILRRGGLVRALANPALLRFVPAGALFGLSYVLLFEAYYRGKVTVVSPLVATESLWGVLLAALFLPSSELVGLRLVLGAALVVAGGALIGAFR